MKKTLPILGCIGLFVVLLLVLRPSGVPSPTPVGSSVSNIWDFMDFQSMCSAMYEIAAKDWQNDARDGLTHIMTLHKDGFDLRKYSDGKTMVVSIPLIDTNSLVGFCRYVNDYNVFTEKKADLLAKEGKYDEAISLYKLLLHFDTYGSDEPIGQKVKLLEKIKKDEDKAKNMERFNELYNDYGSVVDLGKLHELEAKKVENLGQIEVKPVH